MGRRFLDSRSAVFLKPVFTKPLVVRFLSLGWALSLALSVGGCGDDFIMPPPPTDGAGTDGGTADSGPDIPFTPDASVGDITLARLAPDHGRFTGGNTVVIRGSGFTEDATVTFGGRAVQPADLMLIDDNRLSVVVPAGEVGPVDVAVTIGDSSVILPDGYTYDRIYVEPNRGSVSGGTLVEIVGSGAAFNDGDTVVFGRTPCGDVTFVSEGRLTCKTPAGAVGQVDVIVTSLLDGTELVAPDGFSYYDTSDPIGGGLGGGVLDGAMTVTVLNSGTGAPLPDALVMVGEDVTTEYQGLSDLRGQITFSGEDIVGPLTVTAAKFCFEKTSFVSFDANSVTIFLVPWMDPMCGMGGEPPTGSPRNGTFYEGDLVWLGPNEMGPNPWDNIPPTREGEVKVAYVYTTQADVDFPNPDPNQGGAIQRVVEVLPNDGEDHRGYPYRIFGRPAALAVYSLAGIENVASGEFIPYIMGVARNVLGGPGEVVEDINMTMNIPLDHTLDVGIRDLPEAVGDGPNRFKVEAYMDLGGEGVIVRNINEDNLDIVRGRSADVPFRLWDQPALLGSLSDGRYRIVAGWYTGDFDSPPLTVRRLNGVRNVFETIGVDGYLGIPQATAPAYGETIPADRVLRWEADGEDATFHMVLVTGADGNPAWRHFVPGDVREAPLPDLSSIEGIDDVPGGFLSWVVYSISIPGVDFNELSYRHLNNRYWSGSALDVFTAQL